MFGHTICGPPFVLLARALFTLGAGWIRTQLPKIEAINALHGASQEMSDDMKAEG